MKKEYHEVISYKITLLNPFGLYKETDVFELKEHDLPKNNNPLESTFECYYSKQDTDVDKLEREFKEEIKNNEILAYKRLEDCKLDKRYFKVSKDSSAILINI